MSKILRAAAAAVLLAGAGCCDRCSCLDCFRERDNPPPRLNEGPPPPEGFLPPVGPRSGGMYGGN
ncbi:MAG: hypothetical protein C0501_07410 [Isosphaera sp.]|nr:hypothetical protein [Isosphaera sp.]